MEKWLSNLIILSLAFTGLALTAPEMDRLFFSEVVKAPNQGVVSVENKPSDSAQSQNKMQIAPKNDTINNGANKTVKTSSDSADAITWEKFNQMNQSQLESINGIGPVLAKRILDYRTTHGPFQSFEALNKVKGIGPKLLEKIKKQFSSEDL